MITDITLLIDGEPQDGPFDGYQHVGRVEWLVTLRLTDGQLLWLNAALAERYPDDAD